MEETLAYWYDLILRRRHIALQTAVAVFAVIAIVTLMWPPTYTSTAKILVQDKRAQYLVSSDLQEDAMSKQAVVARPVTQEDLNSEIELLTSEYLIKQVIADLPPPANDRGISGTLSDAAGVMLDLPALGYDALHSAPELTTRDAWAIKLARHLHPDVVKLSDVIEVSFDSHDPRWSHDFLARLISQYLEYHAGLSADPEAEKFFNQQAQLLQTKLDASEDQLRQFEVQNGITDIRAQKQALVTRLSDLQIQSNRVAARAAAAQEEVASLNTELQQTPQRVDKEVKSVQDQALAQLKPQVMQLKAERAELLSRYQPTSQRIQEIDAKLAAAQRILDAENHLEVQEKSSDINPIWQALSTELDRAKTNVVADQATQQALQAEIAKTEADLTTMTNNGVQLARLERQVAADKEAYMSYVRKSEEARTAQALNLSKILNVSVAQPASRPLRPSFPIVWLNLLAGFVLAIIGGVGAAYWEEERDDVIYSPAAIDLASGLKTVAIFREET
ncbi:MAG TPA: GumC family protein [Candidatus Binataceae bacterium]|nr:GumC family protein [Candidatus Binataceae bacterium]